MKKLVVIPGLAVPHFVVTVALIVVSLGMSLERFDAETWTPPTAWERLLDALADAMVSPAYQLLELLPHPWVGMLEIPPLSLNSLPWGTVFYLAAVARRPVTEGVSR